MKTIYRACCLVLMSVLVAGCTGLPDNIRPVQGFELQRYLGTWYEIARLDHPFESGLSQVTAQYSMRDDGGVKVVNRGYAMNDKAWQEAVGKAYFVEGVTEGYLKVSFFGPFYGSYVIFELDKEGYQYAFVAGPDTSYLWFLSRTPQVDKALMEKFIEQAKRLGFDTDKLIFPDHGSVPEEGAH
ncbi:MAG: lipocalin family protein [Halioglobus sp.]|nr:lipocalin family protein [Halioglobus sp.]